MAVPEKKPKIEFFKQLETLEGFEFREVLGSLSNSKSIFILCHNVEEDQPGILLLNKVAFNETKEDLDELVKGSRFSRLSDNDIYGNFEVTPPTKFGVLKATFIYPATSRHIDKYRLRTVCFISESARDYNDITLKFIKEKAFGCDWVYNIVDGKKEQDQILYKDGDPNNGFILLKDLKWDGKTIEEMYYQAIVVRRDLKSVRDLTEKELPLLENMYQSATRAIQDKHGLSKEKMFIYFHYQPSYYHLHVHFRSTRCDTNISNIPILEVINNIQIWPDFYQKASLGFNIKEGEPLHQMYAEAGRI
ncbi:unnamed protein product [Bursaphelenchus xylophilus]|uniref:m7GpppX diphosphatase n=1 Tax=Bursaphelenchus xylophilus TaxID=6326 RepID=A0A1I7RKZ0_BURXY|nr:unnamed protein product [Bursaphelenchus xylophilus]CAG9083692.1 unnamed protein product [Bursaphelenchus xylophilus]